jgi:hypothetical protein
LFNKLKAILFVSLVCLLSTAAFGQTVYNTLDQSTKWQGSSAVAVGSTGNVTGYYSFVTGQVSPSLDGKSAKLFLGGDKPYTNAIWWNRVGAQDSATNFVLDFDYYMKDPSASQGIEFAASQTRSGYRYKFSTQCSFAKGYFQVWDTQNKKWVATSVPCRRLTPYVWHHIKGEYKRSSGKALFVALTIDGKKYYVNKGFNPERLDASAINVHLQLDGNSSQKDYSVWVDKMKLTVW